ncbi:RagB/SusD family nutrient uptake outer membrane protein [Sphingobacterium sp. SRCM116780]|uniref:RagB/SusD family nutrient uptake outer membrane protein n=1 Tax=Sphingobacterium sp. SRCM116780 TaxID=2907623 RepID=UPI001F31A568|nr:RagB/SusD family nutrient uptake outer membrane protein [Sphingobacterium sp. SRCM116780]UIR55987.1 RagB/SusD family nutrient uptake outer membrane protein [Sphingobacterium sp. SRCM116780]
MKKRFIYILLVSMSFSSIVSCKIDEIPETSMSDANFWNTVTDLRMAANYFYSTLPGLTSSEVSMDNWSADAYPNTTGNSISDGSRVTPATSDDYDYYKIYQANKLIEKSQQILDKGGDVTQVNWYVGEARFFRAMYYFEMLKRFGGVPLITKTMEVNDPDVYLPRASRDEVLQLIFDDIDYAASVLRTADELNTAKEYGRISKTGALAFKSRVALFEGTREKFHQYGNYKKHLTMAKEAAEAVINSGVHTLFTQQTTGTNGNIMNDAYFNLFQEAGDGRANKENIIAKVYGISRENSVISTPVQRYYEGNSIVPTQNFVDYYLMADGLPIDKSPLYQAPDKSMTHAQYFNKKDPRMSFTLFKRGDEFISSSNYTIPNASQQRSGYGIRKYANKNFWNLQASYIDRPVLRYAEVLLNYAEAVFELNENISDADLDKTINALRNRLPQINIGTDANPNFVSMAKLTNAFVNANGLNMRNEIRRERKVELSFEGLAYWDLIRWKTAEIELPKTLLGSYLFSEYLTDPGQKWDASKTPVNDKNYIILQNASLRKFDPSKDYLWPLPTTEIAKNPKLEQNPNW